MIDFERENERLRTALRSIQNYYEANFIEGEVAYQAAIVARQVLAQEPKRETPSPSARSAPSIDPLHGSGGLPLEQGNEQ